MTSSPGSTTARRADAIASVAPHVTVTSASGSTVIPYHWAYFRASASRNRLAPQVMAYWLMSSRIARAAASLRASGARAIRDDINQYAITWGAKRLRDALARKYAQWYGMTVDPEAEVTVTCGATEAMASALLAVVDPGDEVIVFEPFYENYGPDTILCGARPVYVPIAAGAPLDLDRLGAAFAQRTRAIIVCTPNNPTGR